MQRVGRQCWALCLALAISTLSWQGHCRDLYGNVEGRPARELLQQAAPGSPAPPAAPGNSSSSSSPGASDAWPGAGLNETWLGPEFNYTDYGNATGCPVDEYGELLDPNCTSALAMMPGPEGDYNPGTEASTGPNKESGPAGMALPAPDQPSPQRSAPLPAAAVPQPPAAQSPPAAQLPPRSALPEPSAAQAPPPEEEEEQQGGGGGGGGALPAWAVAVVVALAVSFAVLAGVAGVYGVRKRRSKHKQFHKFVSAHLNHWGSGGSDSAGAFKFGPNAGSSSLAFASGSVPSGWVELGRVGAEKHSLGSSCESGGETASAGFVQTPFPRHLPTIPAGTYPGIELAQLPAGPGSGSGGAAGLDDGATPMDAEDSPCSISLPPLAPPNGPLFLNPLLHHPSPLGDPARTATAESAAALPPPPLPPPLPFQPPTPQITEDSEAEPMELESVGGVLAPNPWAAAVQLQAAEPPAGAAQQGQRWQGGQWQPPQQQQQRFPDPLLGQWPAAAQPALQAAREQQQQQHSGGSTSSPPRPPALAPPHAGPAAAWALPGSTAAVGPSPEWAHFWQEAMGAPAAPRPQAATGGPPPQHHPAAAHPQQQHLEQLPGKRPAAPAAGPSLHRRESSDGEAEGSPVQHSTLQPPFPSISTAHSSESEHSPTKKRLRPGSEAGSAGGSGSAGGTSSGGGKSGSGSGGRSGDGSRAASTQLPSPWGDNDWEIDPSEISICKRVDGRDWQLGAGAFGRVYKALRDGVAEVAVKVLLGEDHAGDEEFKREVAILRSCRDPNVVQFLGACLQPGTTMLVCEYMGGGDLRTALSSRQGSAFRWKGRGRSLALDICRGLHYLHGRHIIHFDIKSNNILLSRDGHTAKIADVGLAAVVSKRYISLEGLRGAFAWAAPEVLTGEQRCSERADIYSLGVVLWELVTGEVPRRGGMREIRVPEECSQEVAALIDRCLALVPSQRPSAKEVYLAIKASPAAGTVGQQAQQAAAGQAPR